MPVLALGLCMSLVFGACFDGNFVQGLPCDTDEDCGPGFVCDGGLCGGLGDSRNCGNGLLEADEECDDGVLDGVACTPDCTVPVCGDGFVGPDEECDGEPDACTDSCTLCGNGEVVDGEECDLGEANSPNGICTPSCQFARCGDGFVGPGEECDDGNEVDTDMCTSLCSAAICGDGFVGPGEACDEGENNIETDACTTACTLSPETPTFELSYARVKQFVFSWESALGAASYQVLESLDGGEEFLPVSGALDAEATSLALSVPIRHRLGARYKLVACNDLIPLNCTESTEVEVSETLAEAVGYFKASNTDAYDEFGSSVALSSDGQTLAVGAPGEDSSATGIGGEQDDDTVDGAGAVYVFVSDDQGGWSQQAYVKASDTAAGDQLGASVALADDGDILAIGAPGKDGGAGAIYVFTRDDGGVWSQQQRIDAAGPGDEDSLGVTVALSANGETLAAGAPYEDGDQDSKADSGAVYVFVLDGGVWSQQAYIKASNADEYDYFGGSVTLSGTGDLLAVGAVGERSITGEPDDNDYNYVGAVYVFEHVAAVWSEQAYVKAPDMVGADEFGVSVALSANGESMAVGAYAKDGDGDLNEDAGAVYVFDRSPMNTWLAPAKVEAPNMNGGDWFGMSVALSSDGHSLAIGAIKESSSATGIDSDTADNSANAAGAVYIMVRADGSWVQQSYIKSSTTAAADNFGASVALSDEGETVAVGSPQENGGASGVGAEPNTHRWDAGAVYLY